MRKALLQVGFIVLPVALSFAMAAVIIIIVGRDPRDVFQAIWQGAFRNTNAFAGVVNFWIPLALCSVGLVVTFTAGLWNIGVEGQMVMGAIFASWAARTLVLPSPLLIGVEIMLAMMGGAFWAIVVGILKTRLGVHEIFGGVALNALANVYAIYLISGPWQPPEGGSAQSTAPFPRDALLPPFSSEFPVSLLMLLLVFGAIGLVAFILRGTRWGLNLRATGKNARSALLLGVPTTQSAMSALILCGMLAGVAGAYRVLFTYNSLRPFVSGGIGFLALLVVLLVSVRILWAPIIAFIFAVILGGTTRLRIVMQLDQSLAGVLQGMLVLMVLLFNGIRQRLLERRSRRPVAVTEPPPAQQALAPQMARTTEAVTHE
jgi:ABC-type uncharacterized transport system permease subunit